mmetsp:Transcript_26447/g.79448  ORF Transcript_26447/g.79448 Transcript_26447/m.79448 type:complete len:97 (+) Transcript_26447:46-336(+)
MASSAFPPTDPLQRARFDAYTGRPGCFTPMVLPTAEVLCALTSQLAKFHCSAVVSIGSGGRLDVERALAAHASDEPSRHARESGAECKKKTTLGGF